MSDILLFVDDNDSTVVELSQSLGAGTVLLFAPSYNKALVTLKETPDCKVVVADLAVNGESGIKFLAHVRRQFPRVIRVVLTAEQDFTRACEVLNRANIFQLIEKDAGTATLKKALVRAVRRYEIKRDKQLAMRKMLMGSVQALVDIVDMVNPEAMGFAKRIRQRVVDTGRILGFRPLWQLELAVLLSHVGCVALPNEILEKVDNGEPLTPEEKQVFGMHPDIAVSLIANIEQMMPVAEIVAHQHAAVNESQPLGARIIKVALDLDRYERRGLDTRVILEKMGTRSEVYDQDVVDIMLQELNRCEARMVRELSIEELEEGMVMARDLVNRDGVKLLLRGQPVSKASLIRLQAFHIALGIVDSVFVMTDCTDTDS